MSPSSSAVADTAPESQRKDFIAPLDYMNIVARWIWDDTNSDTIDRYHLRARRTFTLTDDDLHAVRLCRTATLQITAEAFYQIWLNESCIGHGPAKSPAGERFVDTYDLSLPGRLQTGANIFEVLVFAQGTGTMTTTHASAGLVFQIDLPGGRVICSDSATQVRRDCSRIRRTVRRWILPCIEDIDANSEATASHDSGGWQPARIVEKHVRLLPRPVALPSRRPVVPERIIAQDRVAFPSFAISFRIKPYLVDLDESRRNNLFSNPAFIVSDLISPCAQRVEFVPTAGEIIWYLNDRKLIASSGWARWKSTGADGSVTSIVNLHPGPNRLVGVHAAGNHFEEVHLAAFAPHPLQVENPFGAGGFQVIRSSAATSSSDGVADLSATVASLIAAGSLLVMDPLDTLVDANPQDRVVNARQVSLACKECPIFSAGSFLLPVAPEGTASRLILDLGKIHNGHLAFAAHGSKGSVLTFSFFEALEPGAPLRVIWPGACNNALRYRLRDGWQTFESLHAYGVRYIAIHHEVICTKDTVSPVELHDLRIHSASCGTLTRASIRTGDPRLDSIHALCEQTLYAATDDTLTDCPTYETVNWNFDNRLGTLSDLLTFRNLPILRNTIEQYTRDKRYPGLVRSHTPSGWDNRIPIFCFHWILLCQDYHWHTADAEFAAQVYPQIARGIDEALALIDPNLGLLRWPAAPDTWHLVDWAPGRDDAHEIVSAEQALLLGSLGAARQLAGFLPADSPYGAPEKLARLAHSYDALRAAIDRHLWDPVRDAYADSLHADGTLSPVTSQASNAALAFYGLGTPDWRARFQRRLQTRDPGLLPIGSPMGLFYVLEFLDQCEDAETIFRIIREKWTPMLAAGDKTAWEYFPESGQPETPTRSRCHPFATYIVKYYTKYLLGLSVLAPGQHKFRFAPRPPSDLNSVQGALPIAEGWIRVSWRRCEGRRIETTIDAPPGVTIVEDFSSTCPT